MKKILICASRISHILNFHLPYISLFKEEGCQVDIAAEGTTDHPLIDHCYDLRFVKNPLSPQNLKTIRSLRAIMRDNQYTMVYSNATLAGAALRSAVKRLPRKQRPVCIHISHGYMFSEDGGLRSCIYRTAEKLMAKVTDTLVVMNAEDKHLAERCRLAKHIVFTDGMGLCGEQFPEITPSERAAFRQQYGADEHTKILLCVGEFSSRKNQRLLIAAFSLLPSEQRMKTLLLFAGEGADKNDCQLLAERYELLPHIRFLGQVQDTNALYRSADLLLSAAVMEGLPFNVMEALYCGTPVIASRIKGHTDLIADGVNGLLFDVRAHDAAQQLAERLHTVLTNDTLYNNLKAHAFLDEKYQIEQVRPALFSVLDGRRDATEIKTPEVTYP